MNRSRPNSNAAASRSGSSIASSLLVQVRDQDPDAWQQLVRVYGPLVFQWCRRKGLSDEAAADVGQEVFVAVAASIQKFRREKKGDTFVGWLRQITRFKIADYWRRDKTRPNVIGGSEFRNAIAALPDEDSGDTDESQVAAPSERQLIFGHAIQMVRDRFTPKTWNAFYRTAVEDQETADVAADLDMTTMAVRQAKSRVLRKLREALAEEIE